MHSAITVKCWASPNILASSLPVSPICARDGKLFFGKPLIQTLSLPFLAAYGNLANVLAQRGRVAEAEVAFKRALQHRPNMADAHYNL